MSSRTMLIFAALSGFFYVAFGAFGAHILSHALGVAELAWLKTGLDYQAIHTLAILAMAALMQRRANIWFYWSSVMLALGILLFSGSLYSLALSHLKVLVYITPLGGTCFLVGWVLMLTGALRLKKKAECDE